MRNRLILLACMFLAASWVLPDKYPPWLSFYNEFLAVVSVLLLAMAGVVSLSSERQVYFPLSSFLFLVISPVPLIHFFLGKIYFFGDALLSSAYLVLLFFAIGFAFFLVRLEVDGKVFVKLFLRAVIAGGVLSAAISVGQWVEIDVFGSLSNYIPPGMRPSANVGQPNNLSTLLLMGVVSVIYLNRLRGLSNAVAVLLFVLLAAGIAVAQSKTALLSSFLLAWILLISLRRGLHQIPALLISCGFVIIVALWVCVAVENSNFKVGVVTASAISAHSRLAIWEGLLKAISLKPAFGFGWGQVSVAQFQGSPNSVASPWVEYSHNIFLDLMVWNGVPIGALVSLLVLYWCADRFRRCVSLEGAYGISVVSMFLIHSMLEFPHAYAYMLVPCAIGVGVVESSCDARAIKLPSRILIGIVGLSVVATTAFFVEYQRVAADHREMRFELMGISSRSPEDAAVKSVLIDQIGGLVWLARLEASEGMEDHVLDEMARVVERYPMPPALFRLALAQGLNERYVDSSVSLTVLTRLHDKARVDEARQGWSALLRQHEKLRNVKTPW